MLGAAHIQHCHVQQHHIYVRVLSCPRCFGTYCVRHGKPQGYVAPMRAKEPETFGVSLRLFASQELRGHTGHLQLSMMHACMDR